MNFNFSGVSDSVARKLEGYLEKLADLVGKGLESIVIYGSAVTEEFNPKRSNINLIVVVDNLSLELLHNVQSFVAKGTRKGIVAPLFLTREHMNTSSDVFPIEFLDMSDFHQTVYGPDPFAKLDIGIEHLRLECEEKLKGALINLRQSYLEIADKRGPMMNLISSSITGITSIFRGLIRLAGQKAPASRQAVIAMMAELYPVEPASFLTALEIKTAAPRMTRDEMDTFFAAYLADIEKLALHVDGMGKKKRRTTKKTTEKKSTTRKSTTSRKSTASKKSGTIKKASTKKKK